VEVRAIGADGEVLHPWLLEQHRKRLEFMDRYVGDAEAVLENLQPTFDLALEAHAAGRAELIRLHRAGQIEDEVLHNLERDLDVEEMSITFQRTG
jgi:CPA1 family monovalent cation:H+ antiporter